MITTGDYHANSDQYRHNIEGHQVLAARISGVIENALSRFSDQITRVEVHLSDENSDKKDGYDNMRCMIEVRLEGIPPIAVTHWQFLPSFGSCVMLAIPSCQLLKRNL